MDLYLLPDLESLVRTYVGTVKTTHSRGDPKWHHVYLSIELQHHVDAERWVTEQGNMQEVADAYVDSTPFHKRVKHDYRELHLLPTNVHGNVEVLLEVTHDDLDAADDETVIEMNNGLILERPASVEINMKRFVMQLGCRLCFSVKRIAASCVPEDFFMRRWVRNIGGHGYRKRRVYWMAPYDEIDSELDQTAYSYERRALWQERQQNGCLLTEACVCMRCCDDDPDHSQCADSQCKIKLPKKRIKV